ncbi:hypothetical protein ACTMTI_01605 [Nonomuraea sp. H19]|uniref:hypothetical protein n=1 Tax=Nonomuraea sp. H19 TaxID=3452206 RepID=UPI003F8C07C4
MGAEVGTDGLLEGLRLNPRVLRLSAEALARHIVSAVRAAQQDRLGRIGECPPGPSEGLDLEGLICRIDEMEVQTARDFDWLTSTIEETLRQLEDR